MYVLSVCGVCEGGHGCGEEKPEDFSQALNLLLLLGHRLSTHEAAPSV